VKKKNVKGRMRKRNRDDGSSSEEDQTEVVMETKVTKRGSTFGATKKKTSNIVSDLAEVSEKNAMAHQYGGGTFAESEIDTAADRDQRAILEKNLKMQQDGTAEEQSGSVYRGQAGYKNYIQVKESQIGGAKYTGTKGPIRAPQWARASCRFDYQPDVCKDYKDTGFCGFGDSCKFMHDRGNYKTGWQLEKEWEETEKKRKLKLALGNKDEEQEKLEAEAHMDIQFACPLTRQPFLQPVVTLCGHYFEESAILSHYAKSSICPMCAKSTYGTFNKASKLVALLAKREEALQKLGQWPPPELQHLSEADRAKYSYMNMDRKAGGGSSKNKQTASAGTGSWGEVTSFEERPELEGEGEDAEEEGGGEGGEGESGDAEGGEGNESPPPPPPPPAAPDSPPPPPPPQWFKHKTAEGKLYYHNDLTGLTQWDAPEVGLDENCPWVAVADASGNTYYFNEKTNETTWDKPY
jgi:RING finger protein 113A